MDTALLNVAYFDSRDKRRSIIAHTMATFNVSSFIC